MKRLTAWLALWLAAAVFGVDSPVAGTAAAAAFVSNEMTVVNRSPVAQRGYPLQFGRPFLRGLIQHAPEVLLDGRPAATQADVKNRYPDGSVKYAAIAVVIPSLPPNRPVRLTFRDATASPGNTPLSQAQMLDPAYHFDARMRIAFAAKLVNGGQLGVATGAYLANLRAITNGGLDIAIGGKPVAVTGLNFSHVDTWADVAHVLQAGIGHGVVVWLPGHIPSGGVSLVLVAPAASAISYASPPASGTDISALFGLTQASGARVFAPAVQSVDAHTMLANGDYKVWTAGPVAQTIMLGDDSAARKYDIGFGDGYHPFRPRFYATFWPATHQVLVRFVGENGLTTELEDLGYSLALSLGTAAAPVYSLDLTGASGRLHWAMTTWTKSFWLGGTPSPQVNIDNNIGYLAASRFVPNYDPAVTLSPAMISAQYANFASHPSGPYDGAWNNGALWTNAMGNVGARQDIGPYPSWYVWWLYSGDWRMRQLALAAADGAGSFPANLRESDPTRRLSRADPQGPSPATGLGHTVSITDRKTLVARVLTYGYTKPADRVTFVGPFAQTVWSFDGAHQPSAYYIPYLLTGDPWYLQEMYLWAGFSAARYNGADTNATDGRGPTGDEGGIADELRGAGWVLRNRAETAFIAPDADPEKAYFTYLTNDALGRWEGGLQITGTALDGSPDKLWGRHIGNAYSDNGGHYSRQPPALHNWESNGNPLHEGDPEIAAQVQGGLLRAGVSGTWTAPWMQWYVQYALGRVVELGFAARPLQLYSGAFPIGMINASGEPWMIDMYEMPVEALAPANPLGNNPPGGYFTWPSMATVALTANEVRNHGPTAFANALSNTESYPNYLLGGIAMLVDQGSPGAAQAWGWLQARVRAKIPFATDPKWDIVPRNDRNLLPEQPIAVPPS